MNRDSHVFPLGDRTVKSPCFQARLTPHHPSRWAALHVYQHLDGPKVLIEGVYQRHEVILRTLAQAPEAEEPGIFARRRQNPAAFADGEPPVTSRIRAGGFPVRARPSVAIASSWGPIPLSRRMPRPADSRGFAIGRSTTVASLQRRWRESCPTSATTWPASTGRGSTALGRSTMLRA